MENQPTNQPQQIVILESKSVGVAILLSIFFGPLGMLYSTVVGGIIMLVISLPLAIFTLGISLFITHPICVIWGALAAGRSQKKTIKQSA